MLLQVWIFAISCGCMGSHASVFKKDERTVFSNPVDEEAIMDPAQIIQKYGYTLETHKITTKDGYILTAFRIPNGKVQDEINMQQTKLPREPVLIKHGFINSASEFLVVSAERALPFLLADAGFDVWLGNFRGSDYSLEHVSNYSTNDLRYWNFSMNEMGDYDIPAEIDYILEKTQWGQLSYIGFSMGAGTVFMTLSTYPEYNQKIRKIVALAPAAYMYMSTSALYPAPHSPDSAVLVSAPSAINLCSFHYDTFYHGEFLLQPRRTPQESAQMCADAPDTCSHYLGIIGGYNSKHVNKTTTVRVSGHSPARSSARTYVHFRQYVRKPVFARYDYGWAGNLAAYGQAKPPLFDLKKTTVPVFGMYGPNDLLVTPASAKRQLGELPNWVNRDSAAVHDTFWTHLDFCYADAVKTHVYDHVFEFLSKNP